MIYFLMFALLALVVLVDLYFDKKRENKQRNRQRIIKRLADCKIN